MGARTINQSVIGDIEKIALKSEFQFYGKQENIILKMLKKVADETSYKNIKVLDFITRMDMAYAVADIIISRAGAGTISELCLVGKPVILVPSPNVAEDHQTKNAMALVNKSAAIMIKDSEAREKLIGTTLELMNDEKEIKNLSENIKGMALRDSAKIIAKEVLKLIKKKWILKNT